MFISSSVLLDTLVGSNEFKCAFVILQVFKPTPSSIQTNFISLSKHQNIPTPAVTRAMSKKSIRILLCK
uniref:Uncharacterized protein n=1 Tax=Caenorhabditis japonica TaxID=281687 RepID=A0A8R1IHE9_CAEJA